MSSSRQRLYTAVLAVVPILGQIKNIQTAIAGAGLICLVFWLTVFWFSLTHKWFPRSALKISVLLWITAAGQILFYFNAVHLLWIASLFFLLFEYYESDFENVEPKGVFVCGITFLGCSAFTGLLQAGLAMKADIHLFYTPAGLFLILAAFAALGGLWNAKEPEVRR